MSYVYKIITEKGIKWEYCPHCSRRVCLTKRGIFVKHNEDRWYARECPGSGTSLVPLPNSQDHEDEELPF